VSLLVDIDWRLSYTPDDGDLVRIFYVPALSAATRYDRTTGYFSARALALAARGVEGLVANNGRMRLIVGCTLDKPEIDAIAKGESLRNAVEAALMRMPELTPSSQDEEALELLAWMIANGHLEVKAAVPCDESRRPATDASIFHEKTGIVEDKTGDRIAFAGSINETEYGWTRNWESFHAFTSWKDPERVVIQEASFARLWANQARHAITLDVPEAVRQRLMRFLPEDGARPRRLAELVPGAEAESRSEEPEAPAGPILPDERRAAVWEHIYTAARAPVGGDRVGEATSAVVPWPHQIRAFHRMYDHWPPKLLIADEVGLGKTIQAGLLLRQAWLAGRARRTLVLAPKAVCRQWQIELREKFNLSWPIYDGHKLTWLPSPARRAPERSVERARWHEEPFLIMSSHLARRLDRQREILEAAAPWDLVLLDEAHHARTSGVGTPQEKGPNRLLQLMRGLRERTAGLVLLTATPMQVHPSELWDLIDLLGLPPEWTRSAFTGFFEESSRPHVGQQGLDWLASLFQASERAFGPLPPEEVERVTGATSIRARRIASALRDAASTPRRMLNEADRRAAVKLIRRRTPVRALVSRHTRDLLRRYFAAGEIATRIASRQVDDRFISLSAEETALYERVEDYIRRTYEAAAPGERNAVGFVMTIYRRRLASSFYALRRTLESRRAKLLGAYAGQDVPVEEDATDRIDAGEDVDEEKLTDEQQRALSAEGAETIDALVKAIAALPSDTKTGELVSVVEELRAAGYRQTIVFTQFTDTMDYLRDHLAAAGRSVMCFSGRGGEIPTTQGEWRRISRDDVKRRFRDGSADVLVCTDAAAEGLNFQFCGALVNYDMPWNPMRVEQRIGRIDRLGQVFADIRVVNLHYKDTVEADIFLALRERIKLFEGVVGGLQPILSRLPRLLEETVLSGATEPERTRDAVSHVVQEINDAGDSAPSIDDLADDVLELPTRPQPALTLDDLRRVLVDPDLMPAGSEASRLGDKDHRLASGGLPEPIRVTVDRDFYEQHAETVEFWTPGSPAFPWHDAGERGEA
jgi:superfamily II DNA or RNA helicase